MFSERLKPALLDLIFHFDYCSQVRWILNTWHSFHHTGCNVLTPCLFVLSAFICGSWEIYESAIYFAKISNIWLNERNTKEKWIFNQTLHGHMWLTLCIFSTKRYSSIFFHHIIINLTLQSLRYFLSIPFIKANIWDFCKLNVTLIYTMKCNIYSILPRTPLINTQCRPLPINVDQNIGIDPHWLELINIWINARIFIGIGHWSREFCTAPCSSCQILIG